LAAEVATTMSLDARVISAKDISARRVASYPYPIAETRPDLEDILPLADTEEPLGAAYREPPEELRKRLDSVEQTIEEELAQAERLITEKHAQAEKLIAEKHAQAEQKIIEAEQQAAEISRRAFEEGFASGEKEGRESGESQFKVHIGRLEENLKALSNAVSLYENASGEEVLALITVMAEYLAAQHLETAEDAAGPLLNSILEAHPFPLPLSAAPGEPPLVIFMHPKDLDHAQAILTRTYPGTRLLADAGLSRGSFRLETADTVIDATFERRRERLLNLVNRMREEGQI